MNNLVAIYNLKRQYGKPLQVCKLLTSTTNRETGAKSTNVQTTSVKLGVVLPSEVGRQFFSKDQLAKYGGYIDIAKRIFGVDRRDLPSNYMPTPEQTWVIFEDKRYDVVLATDYGDMFILMGEQVVGGEKKQVIDESVRQMLVTNQTGA